MILNLHSIAYPVTALGPGRRIVLWVTGCHKRCEGCISPEMLSPQSGKPVQVKSLIARLERVELALDGITISGGEPFDQKEALGALLSDLHARFPNWNTLVYSGYTLEEIESIVDPKRVLQRFVDVLIDGPFQKDIPSIHALAGSGNQRTHFLTERARGLKPLIEDDVKGRLELGLGIGDLKMLVGVVPRAASEIVQQGLFPTRHVQSGKDPSVLPC